AEDGIRDRNVTGVQTCALPIYPIAKVMVAILVILLLVLGLLAVFDAGLFDNGEKKVQPSQQNTPAEQQGSKSRPSGEKLPQENELRASAVASNEKGGASVNKKV